MRNRFTNLSMLTGAALLTAAMAAPAQAVVVFDDSFADGDQAKTGALDTNWWTSSSSSGDEISVGTLGLVTGSSGRGLHTIFPVQTLSNVGDKIIASYTYTTPTTIDTSGGNSSALRFGLFDSLGQAGLDDHVSASSGSPNALYGWGPAVSPAGPGTLALPGYMMDLDVYNNSDLVAAETADINFREHVSNTVTGTGRLMATTSNFSSLTSGPDEGYVFDPNTQYTGSITIERISATEIEITGNHNGATWSQTDVFDSVNFDMFAMHANSNKFGSSNSAGDPDNGLDFSNIKVEFVPEPASLALVGLGGLALLRRR